MGHAVGGRGIKPPQTSKTLWTAAAVMALGLLQYLHQLRDLPWWATTLIGAAVFALRLVTRQPIALSTVPPHEIAHKEGG